MRVIDCDECGETLTAANDAELAACIVRHFAAEHDRELSGEEAEALVDEQAYAASDS